MKGIRVAFSLLFVSLVMWAFGLAADDAGPGQVTEVAPGVWFRLGERDQGHCNNAVIEMKDYLIVVDANFPSGADATARDIKRLSSKPVRYVFDTHHHGDHAYGNPVWTRLGATTLAYKGVAEELTRYEPGRWQGAAKERKDMAALGLDQPEPPRQTFSQSPFVIEDETRRVELHFFGWAHTRGDGFVYLPKEKLLCTGDAIVNGPFNYTGDGHGANWPEVVKQAGRLDVDMILPGHGVPGGRELFEGQARFFVELHKAVRRAVEEGQTLDDLVKKDGDSVSTPVQLPEEVANWVGGGLATQVEVAYKEITQSKPHGEILGGE